MKITFNNNLSISSWKITETNHIPQEFETSNSGSEIEENNTEEQSTLLENNSGVNGYYNITITVALSANTQYYLWIKAPNGNVDVQSFKFTK